MSGGNRGFTMLEMALALTVLGLVLGGFLQSFQGFTNLEQRSDAKYNAAVEAATVMKTLRRDFARSGFVSLDDFDYPATFPAGMPPDEWPEFIHDAPHPMQGAAAGGADAFPDDDLEPQLNTEVMVLTIDDADGDGWPDLDASGDPVWNPDPVVYQLEPQPEGHNNLVRVQLSGSRMLLARHVSRFSVERPEDTGFAIPLNTLRVRLAVERKAANGSHQSDEVVELIQMRNGGLGL